MNKKKLFLAGLAAALLLIAVILIFALLPGEPDAPQTQPTGTTNPPVTTTNLVTTVPTTPTEAPHVHAYTQVVVEPNCTDGGYIIYTCSGCEDSYRDSEIPALGHNYGEYVSNNDATCTADGTKTATCERCNEAKTVTDADTALGHTYEQQVVTATCTVGGCTVYTCANCGDTYNEDEEPALGHTYGEYVSNNDATCTADGTKTATCGRCGESKSVAEIGTALGHTYGKQTTVATCTEGGYTTYTCAVCGNSYTGDETPASGHAWSDWTNVQEPTENAEGKRERTCSVCRAKEEGVIAKLPASHQHSYSAVVTAATCTAGGFTTYTCTCGDTYSANEVSALGHSFAQYVSNGDATCTADGTKTAKCDRCGEMKTISDAGSTLGHAYEKPITSATCIDGGYTTYICTTCGYSYIDDEVPALGHSFTQYISNGDATCIADGTKTAKCDRCGETKTITDVGTALGHAYDAYVTDPTCVNGGYTTYYCSVCADYYTDDDVPAVGHSFSEYVSNGDATCTADGTKTAKCDRCDETHVIPNPDTALGHSYWKYASNGDATCTADGTKTAKCDRCTETNTIADPGSALGHSFGSWVTTQEPTADTEGKRERKCENCGITEEETFAKQELTYEEYLALTPEEQQAYFESFPDYDAFFAWLNAAKVEYEENKNEIEVGGDGDIDIGDIIGGNDDNDGNGG